LAFENLTGDPELDYLSDGISDSIITALARLGDLLVIARSSSFTYKGRAVDVRQIGRELGVRHVLEGSLLRSGERLRITAQLIDAATGRHVWAGTYDQDLGNVLEPLDHISQQVLSEIGANLVWGEAMRFSVAATSNPRAYEKYALAHKYADLFEKDSRIRAKALFEEAIALDPSYARAMGWLGLMHLNDFQFGWSADPQWSLRIAEEWCHKALAIDANTAPALRALSRIYTYRRDYEQAIALGERAVAAEPGNGASQMHHAATLTMAGRAPEGVDFVLRALRAVPFPNSIMLIQAADTYYQQHEFSVARDFYEKILARTQRGVPASIARLRLIEIHMLEGREPEARALVAQELEASPGSTVSRRRNALLRWPYRDLSWVERHADALRRAGLPE
jgi:adenylate cyclase